MGMPLRPKSIMLRLSETELTGVTGAAAFLGANRAEFCRRAILDAVRAARLEIREQLRVRAMVVENLPPATTAMLLQVPTAPALTAPETPEASTE